MSLHVPRLFQRGVCGKKIKRAGPLWESDWDVEFGREDKDNELSLVQE